MLKCGDYVKDTITGIDGVIVGRGEYYGKEPNNYLMEFKSIKGSSVRTWVSEGRLIKVNRK